MSSLWPYPTPGCLVPLAREGDPAAAAPTRFRRAGPAALLLVLAPAALLALPLAGAPAGPGTDLNGAAAVRIARHSAAPNGLPALHPRAGPLPRRGRLPLAAWAAAPGAASAAPAAPAQHWPHDGLTYLMVCGAAVGCAAAAAGRLAHRSASVFGPPPPLPPGWAGQRPATVLHSFSLDRLLSSLEPSAPAGFDFATAVLAAGCSFETYMETKEARWERGAKGCDVAFISDAFTATVWRGCLDITLLECRDVEPHPAAADRVLSGRYRDPYTLWAVLEDAGGPGPLDPRCSTHVARSSTVWANSGYGGLHLMKGGHSSYRWPEEHIHLYVRDPNAVLGVTLMDNEVLKEDVELGSGAVPIRALLGLAAGQPLPSAGSPDIVWEGWVPISPPASPPAPALPAVAEAAPAAEPLSPRLRVQVRYRPLPLPSQFRAACLRRVSVTKGVDWHELATGAGGSSSAIANHELCCIVTHRATGCTALVYRNALRRSLVVAFRGTATLQDLLTDANVAQEPWVAGETGCPARVHAGFRDSLESLSRRLKELVMAAVGGRDIKDWTVLVTGHSLGGALATLFAADIGEYGVDAGRGLPTTAPSAPWWGRLLRAHHGDPLAPPPHPRATRLYTFGSPRVGNAAFAERLAATGVTAYRLVSGADLVPRLPITFPASPTPVEYADCGLRVALSPRLDAPALAVEARRPAPPPPPPSPPAWHAPDGGPAAVLHVFSRATAAEARPVDYVLHPHGVAMSSDQPNGFVVQNKGLDLAAPLHSAQQLTEAGLAWGRHVLERLTPLPVAMLAGLGLHGGPQEREVLQSLQSGQALEDHLEGAYFRAMVRAQHV